MPRLEWGPLFSGTRMRPYRSPPLSAHIVLFGSGLAGLGYELIWTRMLTVGLGHEIVAVPFGWRGARA